MAKKFVLLSEARSGTSLITETLRTHPRILAHGEIFHPRVEWHLRSEFLACNDLEKRVSDPVGFTKDLLAQNFDHDVVGFKMWRSQSEPACDYVLQDPSVVKIILERENKLAHFSSRILAKETNVWNVNSSKPFNNASRTNQVAFNRGAFRNFVEYHNNLTNYYVSNAVGTVVRMNYRQAARLELDEVFAALDLEKLPLQPQTRKLYSDVILDRFQPQYHELIRQSLEEMNKTDWLLEPI